MDTISRLHHICLTVDSTNWRQIWPQEMAFFTEFLRMNAYEINVEEMDVEISLEGLDKGMGLGPQKIAFWEESGAPKLDYFYYVAGEDMSEAACMIDLIVFLTDPGQRTQPQPNMYTGGLRGLTMLVDNIDAIYQRGLSSGQDFLSAPTTDRWGELGEVKYAVVKDPMGNHVELLETQESSGIGDGKVLRIFSINENVSDMRKSLEFFVEGCGMEIVCQFEQCADAFAVANNAPQGAKAQTCLLKGTHSGVQTYFSLTQWESPICAPHALDEGYTPSYYRMWHWVEGDKNNVQALWDKMEHKMPKPMMPPYSYPSPAPWSEVTMSFFVDDDGAFHEFANHVTGGWGGLGELVDDTEYGENFEKYKKFIDPPAKASQ